MDSFVRNFKHFEYLVHSSYKFKILLMRFNSYSMKWFLFFTICFSMVNSLFSQERKLNKSMEYIQSKEFDKAEEIISNLLIKTPLNPSILYVKSLLIGSQSFNKYNIDSAFIFYSKAVEEAQKLEVKSQADICTDFKLCLSKAQFVKDSIAIVAFNSYKLQNSIEKMQQFNRIYDGTSSIPISNSFIEELYFKIAQQTNTTEGYNEFLKRYPNSSRKELVANKINEIEYQRAVTLNTKTEYQKYLLEYPKSSYCSEIRQKIEDIDLEKLKSSKSLMDYEDFLKNYPNSRNLKQVLGLFENSYYDQVIKQRDITSLNVFKTRYPYSKFLKEVNEIICEITFDQVKQTNTRTAYKEFVRLFPKSKFEEEAQKRIAELFPLVPKLLANGKYAYIDKFTGEDLFGNEYEKAGLYQNNQAIIMENGKYGVIDENANTILPPFYDEIRICTNPSLYLVTISNRNGLYNNEGQKLIGTEYVVDFMSESAEFIGFNTYGKESTDGLPEFLFRIVNKGLVKYNCPYDQLPVFENGLAIVSKGNDFENVKLGTYAVINKDLQEIIPFKYNFITPVYQEPNLFYFNVGGEADYIGGGLFPYSGKWGLINGSGKILIPAIFDKLDAMYQSDKSNSLCFVANRGRKTDTGDEPSITGNCGLLDLNGNEIIPFEYQEIYSGGKNKLIVNKGGGLGFSEGGAYVSGGKWGVIDYSNKVKVPIIYDEVSAIQHNYVVRKGSKMGEYGIVIGGKYGLVNSENKVLIPITYDYIDCYSSNNLIFAALTCQFNTETDGPPIPFGGKWGAFDHNGKIILATNYTEILTPTDTNLVILNSGKIYGKEYLGEIKDEGKFGLSDRFGKLLLPVKFDNIFVASNFVFAKMGDKYQIYSKQGVLINDKKYDDLNELSNKFISFRSGEKNGILKPDAIELIPAKFWATKSDFGYESGISYDAPYFKIEEAGSYFYATEKGEIYRD